jgi:hemolysin activation/secretion protein
MERSISILNDTPGIRVSAALAPGEVPGTSDIIAKVDPKNEFGASASVDNFGAKSTGSNRLSLNSNLDNPLGIGDQGTFNFVGSQGTLFGRLGYMAPLGYDGLRVGANYSAMSYGTVNVTPKQTGNAQISEVNATYPILRSAAANINSALAFDAKRYYNAQPTTNTGAITTTGDKHIRSTMLSFSGDAFDSILNGGVN